MRTWSFASLVSLTCFTLGSAGLYAADYYVTQASTAGSPDSCADCATIGNSCCTLQDALDLANSNAGSTVHIMVPTVTYTGTYAAPCTLGNNTKFVSGAGGSVIIYDALTSTCIPVNSTAGTVFQPTAGIVTLTDVVFQNSNAGANVISFNSATITLNGTTINSGADTFSNNTWIPNQNNQMLTFGTTGDFTQPFSDAIFFPGRSTLGLVNNNTATMTVSSQITGADNRAAVSGFATSGSLIISGLITVVGATAESGSVHYTGTTNQMNGFNCNGGTAFLSGPINISNAATAVNMNGGALAFDTSFTFTNVISLRTTGEDVINDQGNNVTISGQIASAGGGGPTAIYAKYGSGIQTLTNNTNNWVAATRLYAGALSISNVAQIGNTSGLTLLGGAFFASSSLTLPSTKVITVTTSGALAAGAAATLTVQSNISGSGALNIGSSIASLNATGTVILQGTASTFTGPLVVGAVSGATNFPATLSLASLTPVGAPSLLTLQGAGILKPTASLSLGSIPVSVGSGVFSPGSGITLTVPGNITSLVGASSYALGIAGGGTTILSGDNSGFTGNMTVSGSSTLSVSQTNNLGSSSSVLMFSTSGSTLIKTGSGTLEMLPSSALSNAAFTLNVQGGEFISNTYFLSGATTTVSAGAILNFEQNIAASYSGLITGAGIVAVSGSEVLALTNTSNNWTDETELSDGALSISNMAQIGGTSGITFLGGTFFASGNLTFPNTKAVDVSTSGSLAAAASTTLIVQANLSGSGDLTIGSSMSSLGATGTVNLQGSGSTFTGDITIGTTNYPATLSLATVAPLGAPSSLNFQGGGILQITASLSLGSIPLEIGSGIFSPGSGLTLTVPGSITSLVGASSYALAIEGGGTTVLSGDNSGFTGNITVSASSTLSAGSTNNLGENSSSLKLGLDGGTFAATGNIASARGLALTGLNTVNVSVTNAVSFTGESVIASGSTLTKTGDGSLSLLPSSSQSNPAFILDIQEGELISNTYFLEGASITVDTGAALNFDQTFLGAYSGSIMGGGDVIKSGSSALELTGTSSYTGKTYVNEGFLIVNGDISSSPDPIVAAGAMLSGTGTVGSTIVEASGTIKGGNPTGTLTVAGTLLLEADSKFLTLATPAMATLVDVSGVVTIDPGAKYVAEVVPGIYSNYSKVVLRGLSITNQFTSVDIPAFASISYTGTEVILNLTSFASAPTQKNALEVYVSLQSAIAHNRSQSILNASLEIPRVIASLAPFTETPGLTYALNQLHPAQLKGMAVSQENSAFRVRESINQRIAGELDVNGCLVESKRMTVWTSALGDTLVQDNVQNYFGLLTGYRTNTGGAITGIDARFLDYFYAGMLGAYTNSHLHFEEGKGTGDISTGYAGVYLSSIYKVLYANASVIGSWSDYTVERHIQYGYGAKKINLLAKSDHGGNQILSHLDTGVNLNYLGFASRLFASFDYISQSERGYQEHNAGQWELTIGKKNAIMMRYEQGLQFAKCFCLKSIKLTVSPKISWVREVRVKGDTFDVRFTEGGSPFVIHGYFPDRSLVAPGLSLTGAALQDSLLFDLYYSGEFKGNYSSNSVGGRIGYSF